MIKASYFNDFEVYARDNEGNRVEMHPSTHFSRPVHKADEHCVIGKDHIHSSRNYVPCIRVPLCSSMRVTLTLHLLRSEFKGVAHYAIYKNEEEIFSKKLIHDNIETCKLTLNSVPGDYLEVRYIVKENIVDSVARYVLEAEEIEACKELNIEFSSKKWKIKLPETEALQHITPKDYGSEYKY
jgi:hypothetical protein